MSELTAKDCSVAGNAYWTWESSKSGALFMFASERISYEWSYYLQSSLENNRCVLALHLRVHHSCRIVMVQSLRNATVVMTRRAEPASQNLRQHARHLGESLLIKKGRNMSTYNHQTFVIWVRLTSNKLLYSPWSVTLHVKLSITCNTDAMCSNSSSLQRLG